MVRGLRPALTGRTLSRIEVRDPTLVQGCSATSLSRRGRGATVAGVVRRGKWVVLELADDRGIIVIQPRMTGGFWLVEPERPEHIRLAFHVEKPRATVWYCDIRRLGKISYFASADEAAEAFARSHGPDAAGDRPRPARRATGADRARHQADPDGPESPRGDRQHLRRRSASSRPHPPRASGRQALKEGGRPAAPGDRRGADDGHRAWRARASTRAIARCSASKAASWPRIPSMTAKTSPAGRANGRSSRPRSPDSSAGRLITALGARCGGDAIARKPSRSRFQPKPIAAARGAGGDPAPPDRTRLAIARAIRLAVKNGLAVAPREEWDHLLWAKFDGNIFEITDTIAYYDEDDDELVINRLAPGLGGHEGNISRPTNGRAISPRRSPDHIVRHEIGHALHYRRLTVCRTGRYLV